MSILPQNIKSESERNDQQYYILEKFSTAGSTRGEDGKKCTKSQRDEKIKLLVSNTY